MKSTIIATPGWKGRTLDVRTVNVESACAAKGRGEGKIRRNGETEKREGRLDNGNVPSNSAVTKLPRYF